MRDSRFIQYINQANATTSLPPIGTNLNSTNLEDWLNDAFFNPSWTNNMISSLAFNTIDGVFTMTLNDTPNTTLTVDLDGRYQLATDPPIAHTHTLSDITDSGSLAGLNSINNDNWSGTDLSPSNGGTGISSYAIGDILYASASDTLTKLPIGTNNQVLTLSGGLPSWQDVPPSAPTGAAGGSLTGTYPNPTLANDSVDTNQIVGGAINSSKLDTDSVVNTKILTSTITGDKLANATITGDKLATNSWTDMTLINSWTATETLQYRLNVSGVLEIRGRLNGTSATADAITSTAIPSQFWAQGALYTVPIDDGINVIEVTSAGILQTSGRNGSIYIRLILPETT